MPLIITCGYPCSGKSTVIEHLCTELQSRHPELHVLIVKESPPTTASFNTALPPSSGDASLDWRSPVYADSKQERELRGRHKSEVERILTTGGPSSSMNPQSNVVIMDAPNYIKGYRYELYCLAKSLKHQHAVLFCDTPKEKCSAWNTEIGRYSTELLDNMLSRMEEPISTNRWDSPLLTVRPHLYPSAADVDVSSVANELSELLLQPGRRGCAVKPNRSTQIAHSVPTDFLQELDRSIQLVVDHILISQSIGAQTVGLPDSLARTVQAAAAGQQSKESDLLTARLSLIGRRPQRQLTVANLARAKRQFITMQRAKLTDSHDCHTWSAPSIACGFLRYLSAME